MRGGIAGLARRTSDDSEDTEPKALGRRRRKRPASEGGSYGEPKKKSQAADSERKTRWKRGPVNWTPTSFSPWERESATWTTRPWVAKSVSFLLAPAERSSFLAPAERPTRLEA